MDILAAQTFSRANGRQRPVRFPMIEGPPVLIAQSHLAFQHLAHHPGHRRVLFYRLTPSPQNGLIRDPNRQILRHEFSVARKKCNEGGVAVGQALFPLPVRIAALSH